MKAFLLSVSRLTLLSAFVVGAVALFVDSAWTRVPPGMVAVKQKNWGAGIEPRDYGPGLHYGARGLVSWHCLSKETQILHFTSHQGDDLSALPALEIRTKDNNTVKVDVAVTYRIRPGEAHRMVAEGLEFNYRDRARDVVLNVLRRELAALGSGEWFRTEARLAKVSAILPILDAAFAEFFLECQSIQLQGIGYPKDFENKLQQKQIQHQNELLFDAKSRVVAAEATVGTYREQTEALVNERRTTLKEELNLLELEHYLATEELKAAMERFDAEVRARADAEYAIAVSAGERALGEARAASEEARLQALARPGGRILLAREAAQALRLKQVTLDSRDPRTPSVLDLDGLAALLIGGEE